ncbi:unnamed protein product [Litomosoides sigmodontis]|uniref:Uncharacterized protein n=1 Tax=Litomosoides sigmodontis TaxID=42156 RepID=A0A3P6SBX7_LITSI|nr:unnamed protein product [Litomosoides sigmodontis]
MDQINCSFLLVMLCVTSLSASPLFTSDKNDITVTNHSMELAESELDNFEMAMRSLDEVKPAMQEMNVTESSTFFSDQKNSGRLERNAESSGTTTDDSSKDHTSSLAAAEEDFNLTPTSWNITPSVNTSDISEAKSGAIYEKTDGVRKKCKLQTDCYDLREPQAWSDLKFGRSWTDQGCFCDEVTESCIIELRKNDQLYYTDCISQF